MGRGAEVENGMCSRNGMDWVACALREEARGAKDAYPGWSFESGFFLGRSMGGRGRGGAESTLICTYMVLYNCGGVCMDGAHNMYIHPYWYVCTII